MEDIRVDKRTLREIFSHKTYSLDYYQRGYAWKEPQVIDLLNDLVLKFDKSYQDRPAMINEYGIYFLGTYITNTSKEGRSYIVDGQQRLTTLTLLFIFLHKMNYHPDANLKDFIYHYDSNSGRQEYIFQVASREAVFKSLLNDEIIEEDDNSKLVQNYKIIAKYFQNKNFDSDKMRRFIDWLTTNVKMAEIDAGSDAYNVFITMNERGADLVAEDLLKGYVFSYLDPYKQEELSKVWEAIESRLKEHKAIAKSNQNTGLKTEVSQFIIDWITAQYADDIKDMNSIAAFGKGKGFHKWIMDRKELLGLNTREDYSLFILKMDWYSKQYGKIQKAKEKFHPELSNVYYASSPTLTLTHLNRIILSSLTAFESEEHANEKINMSARLVDTWVASNVWNNIPIDAHATREDALALMKHLRKNEIDEGVRHINTLINFSGPPMIQMPKVGSKNAPSARKRVKWLLARLTNYVELTQVPIEGTYFADYTDSKYHIEHIIAQSSKENPFSIEDVDREDKFEDMKQRLGNLILLRGKENSSENDNTYALKLPTYTGSNKLAGSLNPQNYNDSGEFKSWTDLRRLNASLDQGTFKGYTYFSFNAIKEREALYLSLARKIWDISDLLGG